MTDPVPLRPLAGYYDRDGNPISAELFSLLKWRPDGQVTDYSVVGLDHLDGVKVSTIWLGLDHSFGGERPVIFETLIFGGEWDGDLRRYSTYAEALGGHAQAVNNVHRGRAPW